MQWSEAVAAVRVIQVSGRGDIEVRGVQYDSRRVTGGDVFVAMRGGTSDGNAFIDIALRKGAAAVITDSLEVFVDLRSQQPELALALVEHGRRALAEVSAEIFGHPERKLKLSAVTGTNGKTTTAFLLEQMLQSVGRKCVLLGTIETHVAGEVQPSEHTTPESRDILVLFAEGVRAGCTEAVMEMSSHALEQERVWGLPVDVAIFTNLTQDHLDYHGTMAAYAKAKARLFEGVGTKPPRIAIIEDSGEYSSYMRTAAKGCHETVGYQTGMPLQLATTEHWAADEIEFSSEGTTFLLRSPYDGVRVHSQLSGLVNVENLLAAMAAATARGMTRDQVIEAAGRVRPVPGRFEAVPNSLGITVIVDYAHTDDALSNLISLARYMVDGEGRVITLFGCGGDRDRTKRPKMGRAAGKGSDLVFVTSDNPRSERPEVIIEEVMVGLRETPVECVVEVDRTKAIELAIRAARPGDIVLLAGKGHEKTQTFADRTVEFDDVAEAAKVLAKLKREVGK
jgi:UDP-N-acetylmuramoyl-L-alanyl-D-glutamate--2,6-diaminopimelate ligase